MCAHNLGHAFRMSCRIAQRTDEEIAREKKDCWERRWKAAHYKRRRKGGSVSNKDAATACL
eukprot:scaffold7966_cov94-Skeletonema_dohrnii-CCMP3373.AAC.1